MKRWKIEFWRQEWQWPPSIKTRSKFGKLKEIFSVKREVTRASMSEVGYLGLWLSILGERIIWCLEKRPEKTYRKFDCKSEINKQMEERQKIRQW